MSSKTRKLVQPHVTDIEFCKADVVALQALNAGKANEGQQKRALKWIVETASRAYHSVYHSGINGERDTLFGAGKSFVGQEILGILKLNVSELED